MGARVLGVLALLALGAGPAWAETLGELLKARGAPPSLGLQMCGVLADEKDLPVERFPGGFLARAHINPSAECTVVLGPDLGVRGVLAGWPVATLADGRIVYQRNQVHFASFHPVALALFDPRRGTDLTFYTGLRRPETLKYRELLRRDFEARFGPGAPRRALEADVLRRIFRTDPD